jgi:hypothetical protein
MAVVVDTVASDRRSVLVGRRIDPNCPREEGTVDPNPSRMGACLLFRTSASSARKFFVKIMIAPD